MIWYKRHMGSQTCVRGVISQVKPSSNGEEKDFWNKEKANNETTRPGSTRRDDPGNFSSSGSLQASDNSSEDSHGHQGTPMLPTTAKSLDTGESSNFLFIGPVGKKRRLFRDRQKSGEPEQKFPISLLPATPTGGDSLSDKDPFLKDRDPRSPEDQDQEEVAGPRTPSRIMFCSNRDELIDVVITSTPTPVIRTVSSSRLREDQPLNLSLPSPSEQSNVSSPCRSESNHVSVISSVPRRERDEESLDLLGQDISSPSLSIYSVRSPRESSGELTPGTNQLSPVPAVPSTSRDFHSISTSPGAGQVGVGQVPTFQGLLMAHGIISPNAAGRGSNTTQKKKLQCRDCGKEFSQLRNYRYHRSRHEGTQQFACTCPVCGKTFNDKGYLSSHLKIHRNAKEYKCEWCEKSFNQRVAYNMHVRIHTGHKPHKCPVCPKAFSRKMLLRQHLRTHTGERPYKCEICGKAFADRSNMLLHQRLHSGQRPYKCDICGKSFSKNHHLKTHLNHHAGIKPYQCEKCKACFSQSSNMKTHYRKCSGIPNVTSTVTSGSFQSTNIQPGPSSGVTVCSNMTITNNLPSPSTLQRYRITEEAREELLNHQQQQQQHHQRILAQQDHLHHLTVTQQQQIRREMSQSNSVLSMSSSSIHSSRSGLAGLSGSSSVGQVQSLGLNMGMLGLTSTQGGERTRRNTNSGISFIPLGSPSPTSLAAGHPLIPLSSNDNVRGSPSLSPAQGLIQPLLLSPRHPTNMDLNAATLSQLQALSQQSSHQRRVTSRLRIAQNQEQHTQDNYVAFQQQQLGQHHPESLIESRVHQLLSPNHQRSPPQRGSPQRLMSPRQSQTPDHFELLLPALAVLRNSSNVHHQSQLPFEQFAQHARSQSQQQHQLQRALMNGHTNSGSHHSLSQGSHLSMSRTSSSTVSKMHSPPSQYMDQDQEESLRTPTWRHRDEEDGRYDQFKHLDG